MKSTFVFCVTRIFSSLLLALFLAGCATTQKVDWNSRIGSFTFDQAVVELGPPDKSAKLTDGTTVAEWLLARGYSRGFVSLHSGLGYHYPYSHYWIDSYGGPPTPDRYLRLTFGPNGKLTAWMRITK